MVAHEIETSGHCDHELIGDTRIESHRLQSGDDAFHTSDPFFSSDDALVCAHNLRIMSIVRRAA
jgi:hypothetical protein